MGVPSIHRGEEMLQTYTDVTVSFSSVFNITALLFIFNNVLNRFKANSMSPDILICMSFGGFIKKTNEMSVSAS